jgi:PKD repeat protein
VLGGCTKIKGHQHYPNQTHTDPGINWNWSLYYTLVNNNPTQNTVTTATGSFTDTGGEGANYANDERYFTLIQPAGATSITLNFTSFNTEANWDYLYIYDGATNTSPLIGTYTGTNSPGTVVSSGGSILIEFRSDCATVAAGWQANWTSVIPAVTPPDATPPTTVISNPPQWVTQNFTVTFTDQDNSGGSGVEKSYYQVIDYDGTDWRANDQLGFFSDNFDQAALHADWTTSTGTWALNNGVLDQTDEANSNTNVYAELAQNLSNRYLYHWAGAISGTGTNRRAGFHYFCSDASLPNRGNSYFVFFRLDNAKVQLYKVTNDVFSLVDEVSYSFTAGTWYDFKVIYDRISGKHQVYIDNSLVQTYIDASPIADGDFISFRSGNAVYQVNNLKVYRSRAVTVNVDIQSAGALRFQSTNPSTEAGRIKSIVQDSTGNLSAIQQQDVFVDWTSPLDIASVNDGTSTDISTTASNTTIEANWQATTDPNSDINSYWVAVGTSPGATDVYDWTDNYWNTFVSIGGLNLNIGTTYYVSVKAKNGAGLWSQVTTSNGQMVVAPTDPPVANFFVQNTNVCSGQTIAFENTSSNGQTYQWSFTGGTPAISSDVEPLVSYSASGTYNVQLIVTGPGGIDTLDQTVSIDVSQPVNAQFGTNAVDLYLPNAIITCTNNSTNANGYFWDFGDGSTSSDANPWHQYMQEGDYTITLIGVNNACPNDTATQVVHVHDDLSVSEANLSSVLLYPNPSTGIVTVSSPNAELNNVKVYDEFGKLVVEQQLDQQENKVDLSRFANGTYLFRILNKTGQETLRKLVVL